MKTAGICGFLGVALGAFGAHALKARLAPEMLVVWNTGVLYHLIHALALFALALYGKASGADVGMGAAFFLSGILIFSGTLYALSLSGLRILGAITPVGGVFFLLGWGWVVLKLSSRH